jgi:hypothetical protein
LAGTGAKASTAAVAAKSTALPYSAKLTLAATAILAVITAAGFFLEKRITSTTPLSPAPVAAPSPITAPPPPLQPFVWNSVDSAGVGLAYGIVIDASHNLYATGYIASNDGDHGIVRRKNANSTSWTTIYDAGPKTTLTAIAIDTFDNLYIAGGTHVGNTFPGLGKLFIQKRSAGQSTFASIQCPDTQADMEVLFHDEHGDVYGLPNRMAYGEKTYLYHLPRGETALQVLHPSLDQTTAAPELVLGATVVTKAPYEGLFALTWTRAKHSAPHVLKSSDGGTSWELMSEIKDPFDVIGAVADLNFDDAANIYLVTEYSSRQDPTMPYSVLVRKSADGGRSWQTEEAISVKPKTRARWTVSRDGHMFIASRDADDASFIFSNMTGQWTTTPNDTDLTLISLVTDNDTLYAATVDTNASSLRWEIVSHPLQHSARRPTTLEESNK